MKKSLILIMTVFFAFQVNGAEKASSVSEQEQLERDVAQELEDNQDVEINLNDEPIEEDSWQEPQTIDSESDDSSVTDTE